MTDGTPRVSTERLMREIEQQVRVERRSNLLARGGAPEYRDPELFSAVDAILRRALEERERDALLIPEILGDEDDWLLQTRLRISSHRPVVGGLVVFLKRRLLLPLMRWLYEFNLDNFRRQQRINQLLFACLEELAIENEKLRREVAQRPPGGAVGSPRADGRGEEA